MRVSRDTCLRGWGFFKMAKAVLCMRRMSWSTWFDHIYREILLLVSTWDRWDVWRTANGHTSTDVRCHRDGGGIKTPSWQWWCWCWCSRSPCLNSAWDVFFSVKVSCFFGKTKHVSIAYQRLTDCIVIYRSFFSCEQHWLLIWIYPALFICHCYRERGNLHLTFKNLCI